MNWHKYLAIALVLFVLAHCKAQGQTVDTVPKSHTLTLAGAAAVLYVGGIAGLYQLWYKGYPQAALHRTDDRKAWLQIDKAGHTFSSYQISQAAYYAFKQAGTSEKQAVLLGTAYAAAFFSTVEILDGHSAHWGFSWSDIMANAGGNVLFAAQQLLWKEQRILLKFSYAPTKYASYYPELLGENFLERGLKDYNGQTYWLSVNPASFLGANSSFCPKWLNIAIGYGAKGMIGNFYNPDHIGTQIIPPFQRVRQYYLSLDVDFTRIPTRSKWIKHLLFVANCIKVPFPALEYNKEDGLQLLPIMF